MNAGLLSEEEVRSYLSINPSELGQLVKKGKLTAYKIGGAYVRYRKDEVAALRAGKKFTLPDQYERNWWDKIIDFLKFNGFYLFLTAAVVSLIFLFLK